MKGHILQSVTCDARPMDMKHVCTETPSSYRSWWYCRTKLTYGGARLDREGCRGILEARSNRTLGFCRTLKPLKGVSGFEKDLTFTITIVPSNSPSGGLYRIVPIARLIQVHLTIPRRRVATRVHGSFEARSHWPPLFSVSQRWCRSKLAQ
jgi:hypothetical protein